MLSPPLSRLFAIVMSAPMSFSVSIRPMRRGLSITPLMTISEPGTINAATSGNAADEGSLGTAMGVGLSSASPVTWIALAPSASGSTAILPPKACTMRSV